MAFGAGFSTFRPGDIGSHYRGHDDRIEVWFIRKTRKSTVFFWRSLPLAGLEP